MKNLLVTFVCLFSLLFAQKIKAQNVSKHDFDDILAQVGWQRYSSLLDTESLLRAIMNLEMLVSEYKTGLISGEALASGNTDITHRSLARISYGLDTIARNSIFSEVMFTGNQNEFQFYQTLHREKVKLARNNSAFFLGFQRDKFSLYSLFRLSFGAGVLVSNTDTTRSVSWNGEKNPFRVENGQSQTIGGLIKLGALYDFAIPFFLTNPRLNLRVMTKADIVCGLWFVAPSAEIQVYENISEDISLGVGFTVTNAMDNNFIYGPQTKVRFMKIVGCTGGYNIENGRGFFGMTVNAPF